jgi:immune inhibitor A
MRSLVLASFVACFVAAEALAIPLRPKDLAKEQKSGLVDVKVRRIAEVKPTDTVAPPPAVALEGEHKLLVVLVETKDAPWPQGYDASRFSELLFDKSSPSLREFYRENSYGLFDLSGLVVGPVRVDGSMRDYAYERTDPDNSRVRVLIERAAKAASRLVKLSDFDTHDARGRKGKDGIIDHIMFLYAEATGKYDGFSPIWPHRGSTDIDLGGIRIGSYLILNHAARLGVYAHEFGHDLGLPDLYDRDYSSYGAGDWCTMASGSWGGEGEKPVHVSAWGKIRLGWIRPELISKPSQNVRIPSSSERPFALKIPIGEIDSREFFIVENRRKVGFDQQLPAEGLVVWHIDESKGDNDDETHKLVDVVEATRDQDLDRMNTFKAPNYLVDVFTGNGTSLFSDDTEPSARSYSGAPSRIRIKVLTPAERVMSVDIERPEIFNPGGVPYALSEDGYAFGRFQVVPLKKGSEMLMALDATPGGFVAYGVEAFVAGTPKSEAKLTFKLYKDQGQKPAKQLWSQAVKARIEKEGYAWVKTRVAEGAKGVRFSAHERIWIGATTEDGTSFVVMNPFSTSKRARFRTGHADKLTDAFNFKSGRTPVADFVLRLTGFGYIEGSERPEPLANEADELIKKIKRIDLQADNKQFADAEREYAAILAEMEKDPRRYETWIPVVVNSIGVMAYEQKKFDVALDRFQSSLRRAMAVKDDANTADILENLGETSFFAGKVEEAKSYCDRSRELNASNKRFDRLVENLYWLGRGHQESSEKDKGEARLKEALALLKKAFPKDRDEESEWTKRIHGALAGTPEDKPQVAERTNEQKDETLKEKHKAKYTDLLQFLSEDSEK